MRFNSTLSSASALLEKLMGGAVVVGVRCGVVWCGGAGAIERNENRRNIKRNKKSFIVITIELSGNGL